MIFRPFLRIRVISSFVCGIIIPMPDKNNIVLAAKCAPEGRLLSAVKKAGIEGVELYLSGAMLGDVRRIADLCAEYPLRYALHAPNDVYMPEELLALADKVGAEAVTIHDIFWDDEWAKIAAVFKDKCHKLCVENTYSVHEPLKFMRRYGMGRCLDMEHLQMEVGGVYEEEFIKVMRQASHVHMTGYVSGSVNMWHSHIHHSPGHSRYILGLLAKAGYKGMVVSEAIVSLQTYEEFKALKDFFGAWKAE